MQVTDDGFKPCDQLRIVVSEIVKLLDLFLEYCNDLIEWIASIDLRGEWVVAEIIPCLIDVLGQGVIEDSFELGRSRYFIMSRGSGIMVGGFNLASRSRIAHRRYFREVRRRDVHSYVHSHQTGVNCKKSPKQIKYLSGKILRWYHWNCWLSDL